MKIEKKNIQQMVVLFVEECNLKLILNFDSFTAFRFYFLGELRGGIFRLLQHLIFIKLDFKGNALMSLKCLRGILSFLFFLQFRKCFHFGL